MKKVLLFFSIVFLTFMETYANDVVVKKINTNQLLNVAGKQRMISQKLAKIYLMKAYGANLNSFNQEFDTSLILFERNIETLESNLSHLFSTDVSDQIKKAIKKENRSWRLFKNIIKQKADPTEIRKVLFYSNQLLKDCETVVQQIKEESLNFENFTIDPDLIEIIDLSAKQRMASQRLCLYFIAKQFDLKEEINSLRDDVSLYSVYNDIDEALFLLLNARVNTLEIDQTIGKVLIDFEKIRSQKDAFLEGKTSLNVVYNLTNDLTKGFDDLTLQYSEITFKDKEVVSVK